MKKQFDCRSPSPAHFMERTYRQRVCDLKLCAFQVVCQETDLMIQADHLLDEESRECVLFCRGQIDGYIQRYPEFATTLRALQQTYIDDAERIDPQDWASRSFKERFLENTFRLVSPLL